MIVEFLVLGHFAKLLSHSDPEIFDGVAKRYGGFFSADTVDANQSLHKIAKMSFLITVFFLGVPLAQYMTLRSQNTGALPLTYLQLVQIYSYGMLAFIPSALLSVVFWPYERVKWFLLITSVAASCYYTYKETLLHSKKYMTFPVFKRLALAHIA